jgi:hypothetical protein
MLVHNEDDRKEIFKLLGEHGDIKMIIWFIALFKR